jgi:uncharacterized membrane protein YdbT with pleckstrin-like domain
MSYIDKHLLPGEVVAYRTRLHWKMFFWPVVFALVMIAVALWAASENRQTLALIPVALALIVLVAAWVRRQSSEFAVTNKRVIIKVGFLSSRSMELLLGKIESVGVNQSLWARMLGFGQIEVTGSGGTHEMFDNIQSPLDFRQAVQAETAGSM